MSTATQRIPGLVLTDHLFHAPLDHDRPEGEQIELYAREVVAADRAGADLPWLLFLQGGPGGKSPRPGGRDGWIRRATEEYRVLLLDQRGTGRSSPANRQSLAQVGGPAAQAAYLRHFRADSIVRDAELIRRSLLGPEGRWSVLGQSYGGFCAVTYLSLAPEGLREVLITGGLPPLDRDADEVYRMTYRRVGEQSRRYFARYPEDQERAQAIAALLDAHDVRLPNGERLSRRRFQTLGIELGASDGFERIHYLLEEAFLPGAPAPELSDTFLFELMGALSFAARPLYAVLHEPIYSQGPGPRWAAERVRAEFPELDAGPAGPFAFTGEMIYPWQFEEDSALRPLRAAAEFLAEHDGWPSLYDRERLRANTVPCAALIYYDDMYVERVFSEETAAAIAGCRVWVTNEFAHNGLRAEGAAVLGGLLAMLRGER